MCNCIKIRRDVVAGGKALLRGDLATAAAKATDAARAARVDIAMARQAAAARLVGMVGRV